MKRIIIILWIASIYPLAAQEPYQAVLSQIESNCIGLQAIQQQTEAQKLLNRTSIYLANPELEFGYLWGSPSVLGNRLILNAKQSFDFPTAYSHRSKIADLGNKHTEWQYKAERMNILLSAKQKCIELIYCNAMLEEYDLHLQNAEILAEKYKKKLDKGESNILEYNKAQLHLNTVNSEIVRIKVNRKNLLSELKQLNGGKELEFNEKSYPKGSLPADFDTWLSQAECKSPVLQYVKGQMEIQERQLKLNKSMGLPKFSIGYMSERMPDENFQGISVGISIPLWENKNQIKQARVQVQAAKLSFEDNKIQWLNQLQNKYVETVSLQQTAQESREALRLYGNEELLKKALDLGEISLLEYLLETEYYYDAMKNVLEFEKDAELSLATLLAIEL